MLDHQGIHIDKARLEKVQTEQAYFLIFLTIRCQFSALAIKNESVGTIPTLYNIQTFMNLPAQILRGQMKMRLSRRFVERHDARLIT